MGIIFNFGYIMGIDSTIKGKIGQQPLFFFVIEIAHKTEKRESGAVGVQRSIFGSFGDPIEGHSCSVFRQILTWCSCLPNLHIQRLDCRFVHRKWVICILP